MLITGGILRPISNIYQTPGQNKNIEWFYNIISQSRLIKAIEDKNAEIYLISQEKFQNIYDDLNLGITLESWLKISTGHIHDNQLDALYLHFNSIFEQHDIIIGYEMPDIMMKYFDSINKTYINFILHPVRFYKDLILCFKTNNYNTFYKMTNVISIVQEDELYKRLNIERAKLSRMHDLYIPKNSCLLIGQTAIDRSLVKGDKILSFDDYAEEIQNLFQKYDNVYFKPHPYEKLDSYNLPKEIKISDANTYNLMYQNNIECVYSISSSICYEAKLLNKKSEYFYKMPYDIETKLHNMQQFDKNKYYPFYTDTNLIYDYTQGDLRRSLCHEWSYKIFREIEESK